MSYCLNPFCPKTQNPDNVTLCQSCGATLKLQNRYTALKPIGQGGFGRTFLAVDEAGLHKPCCVIKQLFPSQRGTDNLEKTSELFRQEALRLKELGQHPQILDLLSYLEQEGYQYLVQEFVDGVNLSQELETEGAFDEAKIRQLLIDLLLVLQFVHRHQVIHRDIKPANIIRRSTDQKLFLVDFGAAKYATGTALANTGTVIGSAEYTAPEQTRGKAVFTSDLYSLGATCIHLLTEMSPFDLYDSSEGEWVWQQYLRQPISPFLDRILYKMLQNATNRRYQSAAEVLADLHVPVQTTTEGRSPNLSPIQNRLKDVDEQSKIPDSESLTPLSKRIQALQSHFNEARLSPELKGKERGAIAHLNFDQGGALTQPTKKRSASPASKAPQHLSENSQTAPVEKRANPAKFAIVATFLLLSVGLVITFWRSRLTSLTTTSTPAIPTLTSPLARDSVAAKAIQSIRVINQAQSSHLAKNLESSSDLESLISSVNNESKDYYYQIVTVRSVRPYLQQEIVLVAQAKRPGLYSYTSYTTSPQVLEDSGEEVALSVVCETDQSSLTPPNPQWSSLENFQCPRGSHSIGSYHFSIEPPASTTSDEDASEAIQSTAPAPTPPIATDSTAAEAIQSVQAMNQAQSRYFLRHSRFASELEDLDLGISAESKDYHYQIVSSDGQAFMVAQAKRPGLYSYTSYTYFQVAGMSADEQWEIIGTDSFVCETDQPSVTPPNTEWTIRSQEDLGCPVGSHEISRNSFGISPPRPFYFNR
jgi:serine/threonine protein kinase